jgi:hypothetical protein
VSVAATEADDFLLESGVRLRHEIRVAAGPPPVAISQQARHANARSLDHMFRHGLGRQRRQVAVPVNRLMFQPASCTCPVLLQERAHIAAGGIRRLSGLVNAAASSLDKSRVE